jgi:glycosyltransferase involved in cell wall biosynthesis
MVSIGLAVYNGGKYLAQAIDSILTQTYTDIELIISDNASVDDTADICRRYAARDTRVRYSRNPRNIGGARNENLTVGLATGTYFRFAAHDDYLEPTLVERCVEVLESMPEVVLCHSRVRQLHTETGEVTIITRNHGAPQNPAARFARVILARDFLEENYGVMRLSALRSVCLQKDYVASDRPLMAELALLGRFHEVPDPLFVKRFHPKNTYVDWRTRLAWFRPDADGEVSLPWWSQLADIASRAWKRKMALSTKLRCFGAIAVWIALRAPNLGKDIFLAVYMGLRGRDFRLRRYRSTKNWE